MNAEAIRSHLGEEYPGGITVYPTLPSTNTTLHCLAKEGAAEGTVILAEEQTAGRGRLQRSFASPQGAGLYMSLLLRRPLPLPILPLLTPYAALVTAHAVEATADVKVKIKWVNDLWINEKKIAGILTEGGFTTKGEVDFAVVGIGVNLLPNALPAQLAPIAAAIGDFATPPKREVLAAAIIRSFFDELPTLTDKSFLEEYRSRSLVLGRRVTATVGSAVLTGIASSVRDDGALLLKTSEGEVALSAGEVSIKM